MHETGDWSVCGWRVRSDVPLPYLMPWTGADREPDVVFRLGAVPATLDTPRFVGRRLQVGEDSGCRYQHPAAGPILVRGGREVVVDPAPDAPPELVAALLLGPALAILAHQRSLIPLHACCVEVDGRAVAVTGPSGAGKSTLAAAFVHAGHRVLSDDLTVVDAGGRDADADRVMALPGMPQLKLSPDMLDLFGADRRGLAPSVTRPDKLQLPVSEAYQPSATPLHAIYEMISVVEGSWNIIERLAGADAVAVLMSGLYAPSLGRRIAGRRTLFEQASRIARGVRGIYRLRPASGKSGLETAVALVADHTGSGGGVTVDD